MQITPLNIQNNTNFKANRSYQGMKSIKKATCACCGDKMIDGIDIKKAFGSISKPLIKMIEKGYMSSWLDNLPIWNVLVKYAQLHPKDSFDKIFSNTNNYTDLYSTIVQTLPETKRDQMRHDVLVIQKKLTDDSRSELKCAKTTLKRFKTYRDNLKEKEKEIFDLLEYYADLYPKATLKEIVNNKEILLFHKDIHIKHKMKTERIRNLHFNRIDKMIAKENPNAIPIFAKIRQTGMQILLRDFDLEANLPNLKKLYKEALEQNGCERIVHKVMDELKQMPLPNLIADSFFGYAALKQLNDREILEILIEPSLKTFEHVKAKSLGGKNSTTNGILLCNKCNSSRSSIPYSEFIEYHPYMPYNTQKQILQISELILKGKTDCVSRYWPMTISDTLQKNSDGKINPDLSSYCKKSLKKSQIEKAKRDEQITCHKAKVEAIQKELEELAQRIEVLNQDFDINNAEIRRLSSQNHHEDTYQNAIESYLGEKENEKKKK